MATKTSKKFEAFVELIDDVNKEWVVKKIFIWSDAKEVLSKYSNKYIFVKPPTEVVDQGQLMNSKSISQSDLLWIFEWFSSFKWLPMDRLIDILLKKSRKNSIKNFLSQVRDKIKEGWRVSQVLSNKNYAWVIPGYMNELIRIGESSAKEDETYKILVEKLRMQQKIRSKTIGAMIYPTVVITLAVWLIIFLLIFLVPEFTSIFRWKEKYLPWLTRSVMDTSVWLQHNVLYLLWWIAVFIAMIIFAVRNSYVAKKLWYSFWMKIPIIGWVIKMNTEILILQLLYFWEFAVSNASGSFNYVKLMQMIYDWLENPIYKEQFVKIPTKISEGNTIGTTFENEAPVLSFDLVSYVQFWEESNTLWEKVEYLYKKYTDDLLNFYEGISKVIEPLLIVLLWGAVWYIVWWILLWIMNLANTIR